MRVGCNAGTSSSKLGRINTGRQMKNSGSGLIGMVGLGTSSSQADQLMAEFEELAMPLFDSLYNFARWLVLNSSDAEDLVQETYCKALRSFASFQPGTNFRAWIFQILRNTFLSSRSKLERRMTVATDSEEDGPELTVDRETPETILMNRSNSQLVQRAINRLPLAYREALLLCEAEEMSYQEIAEILLIPIGTVMSRLARARKAVRESFLNTPGAALARDLPPPIETYEKGVGAGQDTKHYGLA
ncbi:MAG TPA: sigma-70 family RNA polymerase sigma factor [Candidatus Acidoferrales bacterium]|nr:sigma-70 family RNA polymerase sigma factor [Candidatus Acidoferrales bacterium]